MILSDLNDKDFTATQIHMQIASAVRLYHRMVGTLYKNILCDEINRAFDILERRLEVATEWELSCYKTFKKYMMFSER